MNSASPLIESVTLKCIKLSSLIINYNHKNEHTYSLELKYMFGYLVVNNIIIFHFPSGLCGSSMVSVKCIEGVWNFVVENDF